MRWAFLDPSSAAESLNCSSVAHSTNSYLSNSAAYAGGVLFSTDLKSSRLTCNATVANNNTLECDAPLWFNNTVDPQAIC